MEKRTGISMKVNQETGHSERYSEALSLSPGRCAGTNDAGSITGSPVTIFDHLPAFFRTKMGYYLLIFLLPFFGCRKPYDPPAISSPIGYLVVEGIINPGADTTSITLSRTVNIASKLTTNPVTGANVSVLRDDNVSYPLSEAGNGSYISTGLNLDHSHQYRLNIKTPDGKQYQSDPESVLITPPIDSIGYNIVAGPDTGVQVYANTHDPTNTIKYYRWDYTENWEFNSKYITTLISNGFTIGFRTQAQLLSPCFAAGVSSNIVIGSSAKLNRPVIYQSPITFMPSSSEKLESRYRILVRQYALSGGAYTFWLNLRKNTEQLGSIFDAQPSQAPGNVHCITNPAEPVAGYVSVCTVTTKTTFIYNYNLPAWTPTYPYACSLDSAKLGTAEYTMLLTQPSDFFIIAPFKDAYPPQVALGYVYTSSRDCADCTIRGSLTPPSFWK